MNRPSTLGRKLICGLLAGAMALTAPAVALANEEDVPEWAVDDGGNEDAGEVRAEAVLPASYDLRNDGLVTPVKQQAPWMTCCAFAGISAAESSMLSAYGSTYDETGLDLSERHLAWFALHPVTEIDDPTQAGEGLYTVSGDTNAAFNAGGMPMYITTLFSQGVGPHSENMFPYRGANAKWMYNLIMSYDEFEQDPEQNAIATLAHLNNVSFEEQKAKLEASAQSGGKTYDAVIQEVIVEVREMYTKGNYSASDDWSIPDTDEAGNSNRTLTPVLTMKDGNVLPDYWTSNPKGDGAPNQDSIDAMKQELLNGHAVSIAYKADAAQPGQSADTRYMNRDQWAQYSFDTNIPIDHAVTIVGWDDGYSRENFRHTVYQRKTDDSGKWIQNKDGSYVLDTDTDGNPIKDTAATALSVPDGDGAWIVKNSWGSETDRMIDDLGYISGNGTYGIRDSEGRATGYFYLSYYDKTIEHPETMEFSTDLLGESSDFDVLQHDYMATSGSFYTEPATSSVTSTANVFTAPEDITVQAVSTRTAEANQRVTFAIYQMNDGATDPTDGTLLCRTSKNFQLAGFHRMSLESPLTVRAGKKISVVSTASTVGQDGKRSYNISANKGNSAAITEYIATRGMNPTAYSQAVVNEGESYLYKDGQWVDWSTYIAGLKKIEQDDDGTPLPGDTFIDQFPIDNFSIKLYTVATEAQDASVAYRSHVQNQGWEQQWYHDGDQSGTTGQSKRVEAIEMKLESAPFDGSIEYRSHVEGIGWEQSWAADGATSGTTGQSKRVEALQVRLTGDMADRYSVWYRVHSQNMGWLGWARDGQAAGTAGQSLRVEAIQVQVLPKDEVPGDYEEGQASYIGAVSGSVHVQNQGWATSGSGLEFGTTGKGRRLEAMRLGIGNQPVAGGIEYEVHAQNKGWMMPAAADGALAGTTGQSRRLEAVRIRLTGEAAEEGNLSVWYRVHSQNQGWLGWAHDGEEAGTSGMSLRAEAIDVQVLPQGQLPRGYDAGTPACVSK